MQVFSGWFYSFIIFGMAFIAAELYRDYEEVRGLLHDEIED